RAAHGPGVVRAPGARAGALRRAGDDLRARRHAGCGRHRGAGARCAGAGRAARGRRMSSAVIVSYGSGATFVALPCEGSADGAARTHALAAAFRRAWPEADVVVGAGTLAVVGVPSDEVRRLAPAGAGEGAGPGRSHTVQTVYDGPDLDE